MDGREDPLAQIEALAQVQRETIARQAALTRFTVSALADMFLDYPGGQIRLARLSRLRRAIDAHMPAADGEEGLQRMSREAMEQLLARLEAEIIG